MTKREWKDGMGYTESLLATNESIVYRTKQHWMAPIFGTIAGVLVLVGGVKILACPSSSCTTRRSAPPSRRCVAKEWRSVCGETRPLSPAEAAARFTAVQA